MVLSTLVSQTSQEEHGGMEVCENSEGFWENSMKTQALWAQFLQNTEFLEYIFICLPGIWIVYFRLLISCCYSIKFLYAFMEKHVFTKCSLSLWLYTLHMWLLILGINCLILRMKLVSAWDFGLPHLSVLLGPTTSRVVTHCHPVPKLSS